MDHEASLGGSTSMAVHQRFAMIRDLYFTATYVRAQKSFSPRFVWFVRVLDFRLRRNNNNNNNNRHLRWCSSRLEIASSFFLF